MKLIIGLLAIFGVATLATCQDGFVMKRPIFSRGFYSGFPDGSIASFFFKPTNLNDKFSVNFYNEHQINTNLENIIVAHIRGERARETNDAIILSDTYIPAFVTNLNNTYSTWMIHRPGTEALKTNYRTVQITGEMWNSEWWRIDVYKFDDYQMLVWIQGVFAGVHKLYLPITNIKSVYIFQNVQKDSIFYQKYVPSYDFTLLSKPMPKSILQTLINDKTDPTHRNDRGALDWFNFVSIAGLPLKARLRLVVWFAHNPEFKKEDAERLKVQFLPAGWNPTKNVDGVFTFYHRLDENNLYAKRTSCMSMLNKRANQPDQRIKEMENWTEVVGDGTTGELEHIWITRIAKNKLKVGTLYSGPGRIERKNGFAGTIRTFEHPLLANNLDQPLDIHGLGGAAILHASIHLPEK